MKKLYVLLLVAISFSAQAQLSGTYTVYGTSPDYATIQLACTDLQTNGQSGPVVFDIRPGTHIEAVTLNAVAGNSVTNTITFKSETNDSSDVKVVSPTSTTFTFNDVSYVNFEHMLIGFGGPFGYCVNSDNGTDFSFDSVTVVHAPSANGGDAIYMDRDSGIYNFTFQNCNLTSTLTGNYGIYLNSDNSDISNVSVTNSNIRTNGGAFYAYGDQSAVDYTFDNDSIMSGGTGIEVQGYYNLMDNYTYTDLFIDAGSTGIELYSDNILTNVNVDQCEFITSSNGMDMQGYYGYMDSLSVTNSTFDCNSDAIYYYTDENCSNLTFDNLNIYTSSGDGIYAEAYYQDLEDISVKDCKIDASSEGIYFDNDYGYVKNVTIQNCLDTIKSRSQEGIYVYSSDGYISDVLIDNVVVYGDTNCCDDGIYFYADNRLQNTLVNNSDVYGYNSVYLEGYRGIRNTHVDSIYAWANGGNGIEYYNDYVNIDIVSVTNSTIIAGSDGIYAYSSNAAIKNFTIDNVSVDAQSEGIYFEAEADVDKANITNSTINSANQEGIYLEADYGQIENCNLSNLDVTGSNQGLYFDGEYGITENNITNSSFTSTGDYGIELYWDNDEAVRNLVMDSLTVNAPTSAGIYMEGDYGDGVDGVWITNSTITADTNCCDYGIQIESDDSEMKNVIIENNTIQGYYGVFLEGDYGGIHWTRIDNNNIKVKSGYGIEVLELGNDNSFSGNTIEPVSTGNISYGMDIDGDYNDTYNVKVNDNTIRNVSSYGIYWDYSFHDFEIKNNTIDVNSGGADAIYLYEIYDGNFEISNNKLSTVSNTGEGIYIYEADITTPINRGLIANNFISGFDYSVDLYDTDNIDVLFNSISAWSPIDLIYLDDNRNTTIKNNILSINNGGIGDMFYISSNEINFDIDNNVYEIDTTNGSNMIDGGNYGTFTSLLDFQNGTTYGSTSFYADPMFVNDTTDLHIACNNNALIAGTPFASVPNDIDGIGRNLTTTTIGAHEIDPIAPDLLADSATACPDVELMTTVTGTYLWSTGATTQSITVTIAGEYYLTVTDYCGNQFVDTITVSYNVPTAAFLFGTNGNTGVFNNTSTNGTSYMWDFGDGNTSNEVNPTHDYLDMDSTYTVTLIATNECGSDTTTQTLTIVDVPETLEARGLNIYPNPSKGNLTVDFGLLLGEDVNLNVIDLQGRIVYSKQITNQIGAHQEQLDIRNNANGIYFLRIDTEHESVTKRIIKN